MKKLVLGILVAMLSSCLNKAHHVKEFVRSSDSVSIKFFSQYGKHESNITIHDKQSILRLSNCLDGKSTDSGSNNDGTIAFYEDGKTKLKVSFDLNSKKSFQYLMNDKPYSVSMNGDAEKYLTGIRDIANESTRF